MMGADQTMRLLVASLTILQAVVMYPLVFSRLAPRAEEPQTAPTPSLSWDQLLAGGLVILVGGLGLFLGGVRLAEFLAIGAFCWIPIAGIMLLARRRWNRLDAESRTEPVAPSRSFLVGVVALGFPLGILAIMLGRWVSSMLI